MASNGYDQSLLASAPAPTKAQIQRGYDTAILKQPSPAPLRQDSGPSPHNSTTQVHDLESRHPPKEPIAATSSVSFWRSTKGKVTIAVLAIIIVAAVVGGAVGGTVGKKKGTSPSNDDSVGTGNAPQSSSQNSTGDLGATVIGATSAPSPTASPSPTSTDTGVGTGQQQTTRPPNQQTPSQQGQTVGLLEAS